MVNIDLVPCLNMHLWHCSASVPVSNRRIKFTARVHCNSCLIHLVLAFLENIILSCVSLKHIKEINLLKC